MSELQLLHFYIYNVKPDLKLFFEISVLAINMRVVVYELLQNTALFMSRKSNDLRTIQHSNTSVVERLLGRITYLKNRLGLFRSVRNFQICFRLSQRSGSFVCDRNNHKILLD